MNFPKIKRILSIPLAAITCIFAALSASPSFGEDSPVMAPVNPSFVDYMNTISPLGIQNVTSDGHGLGYIPSPLDRSHLAGESVFPILPLGALPSSYDLRTYGKVTPVRNQQNCGDCWAFASMASLESNLLTAETRDFSENNLKNTHGFDWGPCDGGNGDMSTAYFARGDGPVNESDDPYNPNPPYVSPSGLSAQKHLQEVLIIPPRTGALDNDNIKQAVMAYGGVYTTYYSSTDYYSCYYSGSCPAGSFTTYYFSGSSAGNHAVTIVGWDDSFPAGSFSTAPPGNGAFLIKNSWGTGWGVNGGYFYISYYDTTLGYGYNGHDGSYVFNGTEPATNYTRVYQYDPLGQSAAVGYGSTTAWFANVFTAVAPEQLSAVSFYTNDVNVAYTIYVYTDVASLPTSGVLAGTTTGSIAAPGYHTVTLSSPVPITSGRKFSAVVRLTNSSDTSPIPLEYPFAGYNSGATAITGQSYMSSNGVSWTDVASWHANTNVCLKAFTRAGGDTTPPPAPVGLSSTPSSWTNFNSFAIDWTNPADPSGIAGAYYKVGSAPGSGSDGTYTTSKPFIVPAGAQGGQSIYVWLQDGAGNRNYLYNASTTLYYDGTAPYDGGLSATPAVGQVSLNWSGFSDSGGSGLRSTNTYKVARNTGVYPAGQCADGTQVYLGSGTAATDTGLTDGQTYYYRTCAYDAAGNISTGATAAVTIPARITLDSSPSGRQVTVDSVSYTAPHTFSWNPGTNHTVSITSPQSGGSGSRYVFGSWSDGGAQTHTIVTPSSDNTYTANFTTQYQLTTSAGQGGSVGPDCSSGCWYSSGASAGLSATPAADYVFSAWTGDCAGVNPSTAVLMSTARNCSANFASCLDNPARNERTSASFPSAGNAYSSVATLTGDTIELIGTTLSETLDLTRGISVTLLGGYACGFTGPASYSIILGSLTIDRDSLAVTVENLIVQ
ncbi:MAG: lectin like domain-containing protein [Nitrospiraceae bacterium]|nr:lectin like domain-containing protein [Nitrospiraceae bacterium]